MGQKRLSRKATALVALTALCAPALLLAPVAASAAAGDAPATEPAKPVADAGPKRVDPDNKTGLAEWMERCIQGNAKYLAKDIPGAIDLYRQAIQLAPKKPIGHYLLAEAQIGGGNLAEAEASLKTAEAASDDRDANMRGKVLFLLADLNERSKKWEDAKTAWKAYADYASKHADSGLTPATPPARIQAIDDMLKQDKAYEVVRQRIADESKDSGPPPVDASKKR